MRALKIATIVMGVLIVIGTVGLVVGVARRSSTPAPTAANLPASFSVVLDEPVGTHIAGVVAVRDKLAVQLQGGGLDRVMLVDPTTGVAAGRVSLAR